MSVNSELDELMRSDADSIIMRVLLQSPMHGYGLGRAIETMSDGKLHLGEATIYPTLRSLERRGLVTSEWDTPEVGAHKKIYTITAAGRSVIEKRRAVFPKYANALKEFLGGKLHEAIA